MHPSDRGQINTNALSKLFSDMKSLSNMSPEDMLKDFKEPSINDIYKLTEDYTGVNINTLSDTQSILENDADISSNTFMLNAPDSNFNVDANEFDILAGAISQTDAGSSIITGIDSLDNLDARTESQLDELVERYVDKAVNDIIVKANNWIEGSIESMSKSLSGKLDSSVSNSGQIMPTGSLNKDDLISNFYYDSVSNEDSFKDRYSSNSSPNSYNYESWLKLEDLVTYDNPSRGYDTQSFIMSDLFALGKLKPESVNERNITSLSGNIASGIAAIKNLGPDLNTAIAQSDFPKAVQNLPIIYLQSTTKPTISSLSRFIDDLNKKR